MKSIIFGTAAIVALAAFTAAQPGAQDQQQTDQQQMGNTNENNNGTMGGGNEMAGNMGGAISDANVAAMLRAIDESEVKAGKLAEKRGQSKGVKRFARMMIRDHGGNRQQLASLEKRIGVQPETNEEVTALQDQAKQDTQALESSSGSDFDKTYIDQMVKGHEDALKKLDNAIANNAGRNERLGEFLKKTRQVVARHLDAARKLQAESGGNAPATEGGNTEPGQGY